MAELLSMGPPVYFVIGPGLNYSIKENQDVICNGILCDADSVLTQIYFKSKNPEETRIVRPPSSWIDDFIDWLSVETCCQMHKETGDFCPSISKI